MKKIMIVLLVVLLSLGISVTAYATDVTTCTVTADTVTGAPGDTVSVSVKIEDNPGFTNFAIGLTCGEGLTLKSIETQDSDGEPYLCGTQVSTNLQWSTSETETAMGYVVCASAEPVEQSGVLFTVTFEIDADFVGKEATVTPNVVYIRNNKAVFSVFEEIIADETPGSVLSVLYGDVTCDGIVEYDDVMLAYRASLENGPELSSLQMAAVDLNGSNAIEETEYQAIYRIYTGGNVE